MHTMVGPSRGVIYYLQVKYLLVAIGTRVRQIRIRLRTPPHWLRHSGCARLCTGCARLPLARPLALDTGSRGSTVFTRNYIKNCTRYLLNLVQYRYVYAKYIVNLATEFTMYFPYTKKFKIRYFKIVVRYACNT